MSDRSQLLRGGARALTGLALTGVAAVGAFALHAVDIPVIERAPHAIEVDTTLSGEHAIVCSGPFSELGADPDRPDLALPVGQATVISNGGEASTLARAGDESGGGSVFTAPVSEPIAAAQVQQIDSETLWGAAASSCSEPVNEQWLLGGASTLGLTTTLTIGNPSEVPATVGITVFDENGEIASYQTAGVIVPAGAQQVVSLNGYAPERERLAVRVTSTGAPVTAVLGISGVDGLHPVGIATVTRQLQAERTVVIPGMTNADDHDPDAVAGDAGDGDRFPVTVQAIQTSDREASATVTAVDAEGERTELGTLELLPNTVASLTIEKWPRDANALVIESDARVYAGAFGTSNAGNSRDFEWFEPVAALPADTEVPAPIAAGGELFLMNPGDAPAKVEIGGADASTVTIAPGAAVSVRGSADATITSSRPVHASVRMLSDGLLASYPILPPADRGGALTVYTR